MLVRSQTMFKCDGFPRQDRIVVVGTEEENPDPHLVTTFAQLTYREESRRRVRGDC